MFFKVGDIVTVRKDLVIDNEYFMDGLEVSDTFMQGMESWFGKKVTILGLHKHKEYLITDNDEENGDFNWYWTDEMFEEYVNRNQ